MVQSAESREVVNLASLWYAILSGRGNQWIVSTWQGFAWLLEIVVGEEAAVVVALKPMAEMDLIEVDATNSSPNSWFSLHRKGTCSPARAAISDCVT